MSIFHGYRGLQALDGSTSAKAAKSAIHIKNINPNASDGVYWIDLPTVGPTQVFCLMSSSYAGGGWMLSMKATTGNTFNYSANYWSTANTLNPTDLTRNNADAKYNTFNYFPARDMLAVWPDITTGSGGSIPGQGAWTWYEPRFYAGTRVTQLSFFGNEISNFTNQPGGSGYYIRQAKSFSGWASGIFSSQTDIGFYGFNYRGYNNAAPVRWGFGWNENLEGPFPSSNVPNIGTNDVSGGIGMSFSVNYSAGDRISCCQDTTGINRSARVEVYVR